MTYTVAITSQGQMSIPVKFKRQLGFDKASRALVSLVKGKLIVEPISDIMSLRGSLKQKQSKKPLTNAQMHDIFSQALTEEAISG